MKCLNIFFLSIGSIFSQALRQGKNVEDYSKVSFVAGIFLPEFGKIDGNFTFKFILIANEIVVMILICAFFFLTIQLNSVDDPDICVGSFVSTLILIMPAHCLFEYEATVKDDGKKVHELLPFVVVIINTPEMRTDPTESEILKIESHQFEIHPKYKYGLPKHDVARIKFEKPPPMKYHPYHREVVGPDYHFTKPMSQHLTMYGYGANKYPEYLKQCDVSYIDGEKCKKDFYTNFRNIHLDSMMCTWPTDNGTNYEHSLEGDSGSPLEDKDLKLIVAMLKGGMKRKPDFFQPLGPYHNFIYHGNPIRKQSASKL